MDATVESLAKALKPVDGVPSIEIAKGEVVLSYPSLSAYEARCSADDAAIRKAVKVLSAEVFGTHAQGACTVKLKCA